MLVLFYRRQICMHLNAIHGIVRSCSAQTECTQLSENINQRPPKTNGRVKFMSDTTENQAFYGNWHFPAKVMAHEQQTTADMSEETSEVDDDFELESLPDTDEIDEEDEGEEPGSDEQPYEAETGFLESGTPYSAAADGVSSVAATPAEEDTEQQAAQQGRSKRRKLRTGAAASGTAGATIVQNVSPVLQHPQRHQQTAHQQDELQNTSRNTLANPHKQQEQQQKDQAEHVRGGLRPPKPRTPSKQQQQHTMQVRHPADATIETDSPPAAVASSPRFTQHAAQQQQQSSSQAVPHSSPSLPHGKSAAEQQPRPQSPGHSKPHEQQQQHQPYPTSHLLGSSLLTASEGAAATADDARSVEAESQSAICYRTRSKHPLGAQEFDPDMFDRLLAEFDPDIEPLMDDAMYQQFLQSLQGDGPAGSLLPASLEPTGPGTAAAAAAVAAASGPGAGMAAAGAPVLVGALDDDDDDDDDEFQLDPLDWLLDDERDTAEEEVLAQHMVHGQAGQQGPQQQHEAVAAARRRTQREAARRAAERIAMSQHQQQQHQQQQQQEHMQGQADVLGMPQQQLQPLIPATAAGVTAAAMAAAQMQVPQQQLQSVDAAAAAGTCATWQQQQQGLQLDQQYDAAAAAAGVFDPQSAASMQQLHQPPQYVADDVATAAAAAHGDTAAAICPSMPELLTLKNTQLQQLYHQISLHTQLLTQLYVMTARDPSPSSQAIASSAGQMLGELRRLHAAATDSYRGQQLAQLVQQAFCDSSSSSGGMGSDHAAAAVEAGAGARSRGGGQQQQQQQQQQRKQGSVAQGCDAVAGWRPMFKDISTVWDTQPLRSLDDVVGQLRNLPMTEGPLWDVWESDYVAGVDAEAATAAAVGGSGSGGSSSSRRRWGHGSTVRQAAQQQQQRALREARQVLEAAMGPYRGGYASAAWPLLAPRVRSVLWSTAEDDLMWLGIIRFHNAVTPLQDTTELIAQELLPSMAPASILHRYKNQVRRKDPTAVMLLSYALLGKERPAAWGSAGDSDEPDSEQQQQGSSGRAYTGPRVLRGPMWAAAELGAALTVAFATVQTGVPSAAAAAAAGVLLKESADVGDGETSRDVAAAPAAVSAGQQLLLDFVAAVSARLPFGIPAALDVPSAASLRRSRPRNASADGPATAAAGQHLLLSLAARQLLQGPEEASTATDHDDVDAEGGTAAAGGGSSSSRGAGGLLGSIFATGADTMTAEAADVQGVGGTARATAQLMTPVKSYVALLQGTPAAAAAAATILPTAAAGAGGSDAVRGNRSASKARRHVSFDLNTTHQQQHNTAAAAPHEAHQQQQQHSDEEDLDLDEHLNRHLERQLQRHQQQQQQQQDVASNPSNYKDRSDAVMSGSSEQRDRCLQVPEQAMHELAQLAQQLQYLQQRGSSGLKNVATAAGSGQSQDQQQQQAKVQLPGQKQRKQQQQHKFPAVLSIIGSSPIKCSHKHQRLLQQQQQQTRILSRDQIAQQLQQLQQQAGASSGRNAAGLQQAPASNAAAAAAERQKAKKSESIMALQLQQHATVAAATADLPLHTDSHQHSEAVRCNISVGNSAAAASAVVSGQQHISSCSATGQGTPATEHTAGSKQDQQQQQAMLIAQAEAQQQTSQAAPAAAAACSGTGQDNMDVDGDAAAADHHFSNHVHATRRQQQQRHVATGMASGGAASGGAASDQGKKVRKSLASLFSQSRQPAGSSSATSADAACKQQEMSVGAPATCFGIGLGTDSWYQSAQQQQQQHGKACTVAVAAAAAGSRRNGSTSSLLRLEHDNSGQRGSNPSIMSIGITGNNNSTAAAVNGLEHQQHEGQKNRKKHFSKKFIRTQPLPAPAQTLTAVAAKRYAELTQTSGATNAAVPVGLHLGRHLSPTMQIPLSGAAVPGAANSTAEAATTAVTLPPSVLALDRSSPDTLALPVSHRSSSPSVRNPAQQSLAQTRYTAAGAPTAAPAAAAVPAAAAAGSVVAVPSRASGTGKRVKQPARGTPHRRNLPSSNMQQQQHGAASPGVSAGAAAARSTPGSSSGGGYSMQQHLGPLLPVVPADLQALCMQLAQQQPALYSQQQDNTDQLTAAAAAQAGLTPALSLNLLHQILQHQALPGATAVHNADGCHNTATGSDGVRQQQQQQRNSPGRQQQQVEMATHFSALEALAEAAAAASGKGHK